MADDGSEKLIGSRSSGLDRAGRVELVKSVLYGLIGGGHDGLIDLSLR